MTAWARLWLCGIVGMLLIEMVAGCTPLLRSKGQFESSGPQGAARPFPEPNVIVNVERVREATSGQHKGRIFGPFNLNNVRSDYGSCDDGLGGALKALSAAHMATGGAAVTDNHNPGTIAEVIAIIARMPGVKAADLVREGRASCGQEPGKMTAITLPDSSQTPAIRIDGGTPTDPLGALLLVSNVGPDIVVVLVAFNGDQPNVDVIQTMVDIHRHATDLLQS